MMDSHEIADFESICRVCLRNEQDLFLIFDEKYAEEKTSIAAMLSECTIYKVHRFDELPHLICSSCMQKLRDCFRFKRDCEKSYRKLVDLIGDPSEEQYIAEIQHNGAGVEISEKSTQTGDSTVHPCEHCDMKFFTSVALKAHRLKHHKDHPTACRFCTKTFNRISSLKAHIVINHPEKGFSCQNECYICNRLFSRREHLKRHLKLVHKLEGDQLQDHLDQSISHNGEDDVKPALEESQQATNVQTKSDEQESFVNIKSDNETKKYGCSLCQRQFVRPQHLKRHLKTVHKTCTDQLEEQIKIENKIPNDKSNQEAGSANDSECNAYAHSNDGCISTDDDDISNERSLDTTNWSSSQLTLDEPEINWSMTENKVNNMEAMEINWTLPEGKVHNINVTPDVTSIFECISTMHNFEDNGKEVDTNWQTAENIKVKVEPDIFENVEKFNNTLPKVAIDMLQCQIASTPKHTPIVRRSFEKKKEKRRRQTHYAGG